jgi:hypothetical protein
METIESLLLNAGKRGLSIKQLKYETDFSKRKVFYFILNSKNINYIDPCVHGSFKKKINVFVYKPSEITLINKIKETKVKKNLKKQTETIETTEVDDKFEKEWVLLN